MTTLINTDALSQLQQNIRADQQAEIAAKSQVLEHSLRKLVINPATGLLQPMPIGRNGKPKLVLSGSTASSFSSCERYFNYARNFLNPKGGPSHAADVGTAIHESLQHWLVHKNVDQALMKLMLHYPAETDHLSSAKERNLEAATSTVLDAMDAFNSRLPIEYEDLEVATLRTTDGKTVPCTEVVFEIYIEQNILPEYDVYIAGAMDMIMFAPFDSTHIVADIKTHRDNKAALIQEKFEFSNQTLPYHLVLSHISGEATTSFDVLYWTCFIDIEKPNTQFITYRKTQRDIEDYLLTFAKLLHRIRANIDTNHWSRSHGSCTNWGRVCRYKDVCRSNKDNEYIQDIILGTEQPYDRYNSIELKPHVELELDLTGLGT